MRNVYEGARTTCLWLGEPTIAVMSLLQFERLKYFHGLFPWSSPVSDTAVGLAEILDNAYWNRLWVVQEVVVSRNVQVRLGSVQVPWDRFVEMCEAAGQKTLNGYRTSHEVADRLSPSSFSDYIKSFGTYLCSDLLDRVYGLLGLASDFTIEVDYNLSALQILERVLNACQSHLATDLFCPLATALYIGDWAKISVMSTRFRVPVEIHQRGKLKNFVGPWYWDDNSRPLILSNHCDRPIRPGDLLYIVIIEFPKLKRC
jgi:hypothetical protein